MKLLFLVSVLLGLTQGAIYPSKYLYWLEYANYETKLNQPRGDTRLWRTNLQNLSDSQILATDPLRQPGSLVVDPTQSTEQYDDTTNTTYIIQGQAYFSERATLLEAGRIQRWPSVNQSLLANFSGADTVMQTDTSDPMGIGIDLTDIPGWIYFSNNDCSNCSAIQRQDLQQHVQRTVLDYGATGKVTSVVVDNDPSGDPSLGAMYFILLDPTEEYGSVMGCSLLGCDVWSISLWNSTGPDSKKLIKLPVSLALDALPYALKPYSDQPSTSQSLSEDSEILGVEERNRREKREKKIHKIFSFSQQYEEAEESNFHEMKFTSGMKDLKTKESDPPAPKEAKHLYFVVNDGYVHGTTSAIWRIYTNGTGLEEVIADSVVQGGLIATAVAIEPANPAINFTGYLYVSTSRTDYSRGDGCIIYRCPLDALNNESLIETVVHISGSKILALALDTVNLDYTPAPVDDGWGWYWYALIGLGGLFVVALAWMALIDVIKLCRRGNDDTISSQDEQAGEINDKTDTNYYPPAHVPQQYSPTYPGQNSLNQQLIS